MAKKRKKFVRGYKCPQCDKKFIKETNLNINWKKKHSKTLVNDLPNVNDWKKWEVDDKPSTEVQKAAELIVEEIWKVVQKVTAHEVMHQMYAPKSQGMKDMAAELGLDYKEAKLKEPEEDDCKGMPITFGNREWGVHVHFMVSINSPVMPDEEAIKRAIRNKLIYDAGTNQTLEEFIEEHMDWDDPQTSM